MDVHYDVFTSEIQKKEFQLWFKLDVTLRDLFFCISLVNTSAMKRREKERAAKKLNGERERVSRQRDREKKVDREYFGQ